MTTRTESDTFFGRNKWVLPAILGLVILGILAAVFLGPKLKSASSSATATPTQAAPTATSHAVVITATTVPGAPTATAGGPTAAPGGASPATATPSGGKGVSTPLPNASPIATVAGLHTGAITHAQHVVTDTQAKVDAGNAAFQYYLDPRQVVQRNLPAQGFTGPFQIVNPANPNPAPTPHADQDGRPIVNFLVKYQNAVYRVSLAQAGTRGPKGIWLIVTVLPPGQYSGVL